MVTPLQKKKKKRKRRKERKDRDDILILLLGHCEALLNKMGKLHFGAINIKDQLHVFV